MALLASASTFAAEDTQASLGVAVIGDVAGANLPESIKANNPNVNTNNKFGFGLAVLFGQPIHTGLGIETGALFIDRRFQYGDTAYNFTQTQWTMQIPVIVRMSLGELFSVGAGPYVSFPIGKVQNSFTLGDSTVTPFSYDRKNFELGLTGVVTVNIPTGQHFSAFVEARYTYGLTSLDHADNQIAKTNDLSALAGIRFSL